MSPSTRRGNRNKLGNIYSKGEANKITDAIFHPHFKNNPETIILDSLAHALIERDPSTSIKKFAKYNAPIIIGELTRHGTLHNRSSKPRKHHRGIH